MSKEFNAKTPTIHVYGQMQWHDDAFICGNRLGMEKLRYALNMALEKGSCELKDVFTTDGEGYGLTLSVLDQDDTDALVHCYHDNEIFGYIGQADGLHPYDKDVAAVIDANEATP